MEEDHIKIEYKEKMKKKLYGLLREKEKNGEWEKFLDAILIELLGFNEEAKTINYYSLSHKLASCRMLSFKYFRKTIFDCMDLFERIDL